MNKTLFLFRKIQFAMTKIIFLDFDGVLNTEQYRCTMAQNGENAYDRYGFFFDPDAMFNLKTIIAATSAKVCITSSWALEIGAKELARFWKDRDMPGTLLGTSAGIPVTPDTIYDDYFDPYKLMETGVGGRGSEIESFLEAKGYKNVRYVIIDDVPDFKPEQAPFFVRTDPRVGITRENADQAIQILNDTE